MTAMTRLCFLLLIPYVLCETTQLLQTCTSCGPECESSCGSRNFRTCCYNYLKKRSPVPPLPPQDSVVRSKFPWLSALLDGASTSRNSGLNSDRDVQVQLFLSPEWLSSDSLNQYRDYSANYQDNPSMGGLVGLTEIQATEAPSMSGPIENADTSSESNSEEKNQGSRESATRGHGRQNQHRQQPVHWKARNQRQHTDFPWSEVNRRLPMYGA